MRNSAGAYKVIGLLLPVAFGVSVYAYYTWRKRKQQLSQPKRHDSNSVSQPEALKAKGNELYKSKDYKGALKFYNDAIALCSKSNTRLLSILHANIAAVYDGLKDYKKAVEFCTKALEFDKKYAKALHRRAACKERLGEITEAIEDYAAASVMNDDNPNEDQIKKMDELITELSHKRAKDLLKERKEYKYSPYLIKTHINTTFPDDCVLGKEAREKFATMEKFSDSHFAAALKKLDAFDCYGAIKECNEELTVEGTPFYWQTILLRGTLSFFVAEEDDALKDFDLIIANYSQTGEKLCLAAHLRKASLYMQDMNLQGSISEIETALTLDPNRSLTSVFMGQIHLLSGRYNEALTWFDKALALEPDSPSIKSQKYVVECKLKRDNNQAVELAESLKNFHKLITEHPDDVSIRLEYAQTLSESGNYDAVNGELEIALQKATDAERGQILVQKASHLLSYSADYKRAEQLLLEALKCDDAFESVYQLLGFLYLQRNDISSALDNFVKSAALGRREEMIAYTFHVIICLEVQKALIEKFHMDAEKSNKFIKNLNFKWLNAS